MDAKLIEFMQNEYAYVDSIVCLALAHDGEYATDTLEQFLDDAEDATINKTFGFPLTVELEFGEDEEDDSRLRRERILAELVRREINGFLVHLKICVREYRAGDKSFRASLGYTYEHHFYVPDLDASFDAKVRELVNASIERDKAKPPRA